MTAFTIEIVEGAESGRQVSLGGPLLIGRAPDAGLVLSDPQVSRRHALVTPDDLGASVEDLGSANGTYINQSELHARARLDPGDELLVGTTLMQLRTAREVAAEPSAVRPVPPALAAPARPPSYLGPGAAAQLAEPSPPSPSLDPELTALLDVYTKTRAQTAPLAIFVLVVLVLLLYLATR
ncbi:MAG TPA: FHA domain-containing protein [Solirubrobacteraceae bacterium]|nr:FHA domain-containing protein [Solirubrobacteraceae bacterium]